MKLHVHVAVVFQIIFWQSSLFRHSLCAKFQQTKLKWKTPRARPWFAKQNATYSVFLLLCVHVCVCVCVCLSVCVIVVCFWLAELYLISMAITIVKEFIFCHVRDSPHLGEKQRVLTRPETQFLEYSHGFNVKCWLSRHENTQDLHVQEGLIVARTCFFQNKAGNTWIFDLKIYINR